MAKRTHVVRLPKEDGETGYFPAAIRSDGIIVDCRMCDGSIAQLRTDLREQAATSDPPGFLLLTSCPDPGPGGWDGVLMPSL
ncbi:MAG TPA: hypothetical protein VM537_32490 [Anaerolineae bacterium]|nr:hypothetical protein [Anaerolineae bacterium]